MHATPLTVAVLGLSLALGSTGCRSLPSVVAGSRVPDVIFVPTPQEMVDAMLRMADVKPGEKVYDLGCGDGRIVVTAARDFGARGVGVDIDPQRIADSRRNVAQAGVGDRVEIRQADLFTMDFSDADVVALYLLPALNLRLRPRLLDELRPATRIVSNSFDMDTWHADQEAEHEETGQMMFFWVVPAKVQGIWNLALPDDPDGLLVLRQEFQVVTGSVRVNGVRLPLREPSLRGRTLTFSYGEGEERWHAVAEVQGNELSGTVRRGPSGDARPWSGRRSL